jgi:hypothetical protein
LVAFHLGPKVLPGPKDLRDHQAHRELKDLRGHKAFKGLKAFRGQLDLLGSKARRDLKAPLDSVL